MKDDLLIQKESPIMAYLMADFLMPKDWVKTSLGKRKIVDYTNHSIVLSQSKSGVVLRFLVVSAVGVFSNWLLFLFSNTIFEDKESVGNVLVASMAAWVLTIFWILNHLHKDTQGVIFDLNRKKIDLLNIRNTTIDWVEIPENASSSISEDEQQVFVYIDGTGVDNKEYKLDFIFNKSYESHRIAIEVIKIMLPPHG